MDASRFRLATNIQLQRGRRSLLGFTLRQRWKVALEPQTHPVHAYVAAWQELDLSSTTLRTKSFVCERRLAGMLRG